MLDTTIPYSIKRTGRRKTASLQIVNGRVTIVVPHSLSEQRISDIVHLHLERINKTVASQRQLMRKTETEFVSGQGVLYLGRTYRLKILCTESEKTGLRNGRLVVWTNPNYKHREEDIKDLLTSWYRHRAEEKFNERLKIYEEKVGVSVSSLAVKDMRTKWGSCTAKGKITLNWRLVLAPIRVIDYVIVHELCHILCHDHSRKFWSKVMRVLPDYEQRRDWLKQNGHLLSL